MLTAICLFVIALSGAGLVSIALSHEITGVDALLLALICLTMGGLFTLFLIFVLRGAKSNGSSGDAAAGK
jgi:hypothetical protein